MLNYLLSRSRLLDEQEQGYFDSLANEIHRYEVVALPMPQVSGAEMLKFLMEQQDVSLSDVAKNTRIVVSTLSAILTKKRKLNLNHMKGLARYFGVEIAAFI